MLQIIDAEGRVVGDLPTLDDKELVELYRLMALARKLDRKLVALQRQGRIGTFPPLEGQEATQIGSAFALSERDWVYPSYREHGVQIVRGMPLKVIMSYWAGLPNSEWDVRKFHMNFNTVPLATQLPHAVGHSYAARLAGDELVTMAYVGDGATSEGDFHSGMNFAGVWKTPTVFICSNNLWAISVPLSKQTAAPTLADKAIGYGMPGVRVDGMDVLAVYAAATKAVDNARSGQGPTFIEALTYRYGPHATADDPRLYRTAEAEDEWRRRDPLDRYTNFLQSRDLWSPDLDEEIEEDIDRRITSAIEEVEACETPTRDVVVRHAYHRIPPALVSQLHQSQADHGEELTAFEPSELWEIAHDQLPSGDTSNWTMAQAITAALEHAMQVRQETVILGEDVGTAGGVFRITKGLVEQFGADRVIDTPLDEAGIIGASIGMAIGGGRPVAEIQFDGFVYSAFDQIVSHLGRMRTRTRSNLEMPIVVRWPNGGGTGAAEFHGDSPETYFAHAPGLVVVVPSTPTDAKGLLAAALEGHDPVLFLEPKVLYRSSREPVPTDHYTLPIGRAKVRRPGSDLTLVTYGGMVPVSLKAAEQAAEEQINVEVIDLRTLWPWDEETVLESVERNGRLVLVQEPPRSAGMAAEVAATVAEKLIYSLQAPIVRITGFDAPWPQFTVEHAALVSATQVLAGIRRVME